jgi:tetratricopeptide (TPR) repeat protein
MLFDLRGRGRRRTIQVIYLGLAILMGGGLVLFGVGTGGGGGGLLNAFNPTSGSSAAKAFVSQQTKTAEKLTKLQPTNPQAWASLTHARFDDASQGFDQTTQTYSPAGRASLAAAGQAWQQYLKLVKKPDPTLARLMAEAYQGIGDFKQSAVAWQMVAGANPKVATYWAYLAAAAYQAKELDLGNLASAKAISLTPKANRATLLSQLNQLKTAATPTTATAAPTTTTVTPTTTTITPTTTTKTKSKAKTK